MGMCVHQPMQTLQKCTPPDPHLHPPVGRRSRLLRILQHGLRSGSGKGKEIASVQKMHAEAQGGCNTSTRGAGFEAHCFCQMGRASTLTYSSLWCTMGGWESTAGARVVSAAGRVAVDLQELEADFEAEALLEAEGYQ